MVRWKQEQRELLWAIVGKLDALIRQLHAEASRHLPTYVRCSCGWSTVVMWDEASQSYEGPKGWTFNWEENGGWTCGQDGHRQAEAHYILDYDRDPIVHQDETH